MDVFHESSVFHLYPFSKVNADYVPVLAVIPAKAGIQEFWMLDRVQHDKARASADY